tara:strand:+ start:3901 stop:4263 length:363 start_codon:yes stop_codon:yes gene_type:complete
MKVLVAGGRDFDNKDWLFKELNAIHSAEPITQIIDGGARGADSLAYLWAHQMGIDNYRAFANWEKYGKKAGWVRNNEMADLGPDLVVLFPGGVGTQMMYDIALKRNIMILDLRDEDKDEI